MSVMYGGLIGTTCLYNPMLIGAMNNTEDMDASAMDLAAGV